MLTARASVIINNQPVVTVQWKQRIYKFSWGSKLFKKLFAAPSQSWKQAVSWWRTLECLTEGTSDQKMSCWQLSVQRDQTCNCNNTTWKNSVLSVLFCRGGVFMRQVYSSTTSQLLTRPIPLYSLQAKAPQRACCWRADWTKSRAAAVTARLK